MSSRYRYSRSSSGRQRQKLDFDFKQMDSRVYFGGALAVIVLFGTLFYLLVVTMLPMKVNNSLAHMTPETVALSMQPAVSERLAERSFTLLVDGREELFYLGDYDFTVSPHSDGYSEEITYTDENGMEKTKIITTKGNLCFNETAVRQFIYDLAKEYGTPMVEPHYTIKGDKMTVYKGTDGIGIDYNYLIAALSQRIAAGDNSPITTQIITLVAPEVDIDEIYRTVKCAPENAYVTLDAAGNPKFTADIIGKDFDLTAARNRMEASPDAGQWEIQLTLTYPEISLKQVRAPYCLDELSDCTTSYKGSSAERRNNVEQAATKINTYNGATDGMILQPGEEFSFNSVVGQRTAANGFMKAPVYLSSGSTEDYGGGICQVSTTLYCAALYANLKITERHNHLYVIHYWPTEGCDATVDWGHLDFKFKNDKEYPIKIRFTWENSKLTATITGTADGITAKLQSEVENTVAYSVNYKRTTMEYREGYSVGGDKGKTIRVWRIVYQDGKQISKKKESYNLYNPLAKTVYTDHLPAGATYS